MLRASLLTLTLAATVVAVPTADDATRVPGIEDLLTLRTVGGVQISPDGKWVVYAVTETDLDQDAYVNQLFVVPAVGGPSIQLTRGAKSATSAQWSPDSQWVAFLSPRASDKNQIFAIRPDGGEAVQLTKSETAVNGFEWSVDGARIAYLAADAESKERKARKDRMGDFEVVRSEYVFTHIWTFDVAEALKVPVAGTQRTKGSTFNVGSLAWSPDGATLAFHATKNPDLVQSHTADVYTLDLASDKVTPLVTQAGPDTGPRWSPDGSTIAFESAMGRPDFFHANGRIAVVAASGGMPVSVTDAFDEDPNLIDWTGLGIVFSGLRKTTSHLFVVDPASKAVTRISQPDALIGSAFSLSKDGSSVAFGASSPTTMAEVYGAERTGFAARKLTDMTAQLASFRVGRREVVSWKSQDGTTIEGVLVRPADFDATKKYPLLVITHGGPTGIDRPVLIENRYYPVDAWVGRGAMVLKVNYRGSAGYGEKFRQLNVRNLGVGDAWDVVSGIDNLVKQGWVDPSRVGCMGWSQGGYISAFLTTSTTKCAAVSVGAGISNWATYYYNTDITPFTIQYLGKDPAADPAIYQKTSPMTHILQAKTPTLIQHGENDRRVPIPNAYELRQGLEDRGVPVSMVVYKGFGHGITKPKAMRAVMRHNLEWFNHYLWKDPAPEFANPTLP
ncbi:MAG: S9 family peptidase [Vicinamibacteria bacterium]|nr:S9 family peptidase [Vicinamibacteria bacterium]